MSVAVAGGQPADDVWGSKGQYCRMYDPSTVETVSGEVAAVRQFTPPGPGASGVRFTLTTAKGPIEVILGPGWFVESQDFKLWPHDQVTVKGSRVAVEGHSTIIAAEVTKGPKTWKLRHHSGMPVWVPKSGLEGTG
ncbi:MAG: hypothetical protein WC443_11395 [Desulfobaccales bacterium]